MIEYSLIPSSDSEADRCKQMYTDDDVDDFFDVALNSPVSPPPSDDVHVHDCWHTLITWILLPRNRQRAAVHASPYEYESCE